MIALIVVSVILWYALGFWACIYGTLLYDGVVYLSEIMDWIWFASIAGPLMWALVLYIYMSQNNVVLFKKKG